MMNRETVCAVVRDLLPSYLDGLTEGATNAFIEQHLTECESCRAVKRSMQQITTPAEQAQAELLGKLRRARRRRTRRAWALAISIMIVLTACLVPLPKSVNMEVQAIRWRAGAESEGGEPVQVIIRGIYMDYLFRADTFDGDIMIEGVEITQRADALSRVTMDPEGYLAYMNEEGLLRSTGFIVGGAGFEEFVIGLYDYDEGESHGSWSGSDGLVVTWPAASREEAVETTRRIVLASGSWLAEGVWEGGMTREEYEAREK